MTKKAQDVQSIKAARLPQESVYSKGLVEAESTGQKTGPGCLEVILRRSEKLKGYKEMLLNIQTLQQRLQLEMANEAEQPADIGRCGQRSR